MSYLYSGTILRVDLSKGCIIREPTASYSGDFLGGRGINARILYEGVPPEIDPLDPESLLIMGAGPLCGTPVSASRVEVTAKSPETGFLGTCNFGGFFGPELKFAGYDHIVISGKADKPVYLLIYNDQVEIRDASHLWGKDTYQTQEILRSELSPEFKIVCIGPAGENLVRFSTLQHELKHAAARTGMGAVAGSKKLKAIVVRGTNGIEIANPEKYLDVAIEIQQKLRNHPPAQEKQKYGSAPRINAERLRAAQSLAYRPPLSIDAVLKYKSRIKKTGCFSCPVQCMEIYPREVGGGGAISCNFYDSPFYVVKNTDVDSMLEYGFLAQRYGVDEASLMRIMAWLMRIYEKGIIDAHDTDGIPMEWGSHKAIIGIMKKIVYREGIGDLLADGLLPAAKSIGRGSIEYAYNMKGLPLHNVHTTNDIIPAKGEALALAMSPRADNLKVRTGALEEIEVIEQSLIFPDDKSGANYIESVKQKVKLLTGTEKAFLRDEYEGKPELVSYMEDSIIIADSLSACKYCGSFLNYPFQEEYYALLLSLGTGKEIDIKQLFQIARRIRNLERAYSVREGVTRELDSYPKKFMDKEIKYKRYDYKDRADIRLVERTAILNSTKFEEMKDKYYALRGWDIATGIPTRETLEKLGLKDVARDLEKRGKLPNKPSK